MELRELTINRCRQWMGNRIYLDRPNPLVNLGEGMVGGRVALIDALC